MVVLVILHNQVCTYEKFNLTLFHIPDNYTSTDLTLIVSRLENLEVLTKQVIRESNVTDLDIWTENGRSKKEQGNFKNDLIKYYKRKKSYFSTDLHCMILDQPFPRDQVIASHIWKYSTRGRGLQKFGLTVKDETNPRNGLLLVKALEEAFDVKYICFLYNPITQKIFLKVLNPQLLDEVVVPSTKTFREIDGSHLCHPASKFPYRRLLNFHAVCSYKHAKEQGWSTIGDLDVVQSFFELSDGASMPEI